MSKTQKGPADTPYQIFSEISNAGKNVQGTDEILNFLAKLLKYIARL